MTLLRKAQPVRAKGRRRSQTPPCEEGFYKGNEHRSGYVVLVGDRQLYRCWEHLTAGQKEAARLLNLQGLAEVEVPA